MRILFIAGVLCGAFVLRCTEPVEEIPLVINEFMVRNSASSLYKDCLGNHEDWVELYNAGDEALSMGSIYISDRVDNLRKKRLHDTIIPPGGHYLLWGGDHVCSLNYHLGFSFAVADTAKQEVIVISDGKGNIIDCFYYMMTPHAHTRNRSYGRFPDGSDNWHMQGNATPGFSNEG